MAPQAFDDVKDMFHLCAHAALPAIPFTIPLAQCAVPTAAPLHPPVNACRLDPLLPFASDVCAIAIERAFTAMKQIIHYVRIVHARGGYGRAVRQAAGT